MVIEMQVIVVVVVVVWWISNGYNSYKCIYSFNVQLNWLLKFNINKRRTKWICMKKKKNSRNSKKNKCKPIIIFPAACPFIILNLFVWFFFGCVFVCVFVWFKFRVWVRRAMVKMMMFVFFWFGFGFILIKFMGTWNVLKKEERIQFH